MAADKAQLDPSVKAGDRYRKLEQNRSQYVDRGRECAVLTIPSVLPASGFSASSKLPTPYQSLGARGVRTLASKLLLSLFPGVPFFNYRVDDHTLSELGAKRGEIEAALASRERAVATELDTCVFRPAAFVALVHLLVTGNALIYVPVEQDERAKVYRLDQYVCRRDAAGNLLEIIIQEQVDIASLPPELRDLALKDPDFKDHDPKKLDPKPIDVFTHIYWDEVSNNWRCYQEIGGEAIPGSDGTYKKDELPWLALRFATQPGEDYGRSYVEEYLGDLDSLEALSEALVEGSSAAARILFLVDPAGTTSLKVVSDAPNGAVRAGRADDVTVMQLQKSQDLSVAKSQAEEIANRLSYAFLLHSSVQRQGERVTAEEIRYMASELDDGLGGVYTLFAADFQLPIVRLFEKRMEKRLKQPKLPESVKYVIVSGLEAIGRGHDQRNLAAFIKEIVAVVGPEIAFKYLKPSEFMKRAAAGYNIDTTDLLATEDEIAQQEQQAQMMAMVQQLGPQAITQMGGMGNTALKASLPPPAATAPQAQQ